MESRFGIKDLFLYALVGVLLIVVLVAMWQFDRQFDRVVTIQEKQGELIVQVEQIRRQIEQGLVVASPASGGAPTTGQTSAASTKPAADVFAHLRAAEKMEGFARGDWFVDDFGTKVGKLTPLVSSDVYQRWIELLVCEAMASRDPFTLEYVPRLATRWDISADGLTMRFFLRRGVTFSDGSPLTADDVVFTFDWIRNPKVQADRERAYLTKLREVRKIDDLTVEFTFGEPYFLNFEVAAGTPILSKAFYGKFDPDVFNERTGLLIGSGPYMLENPENWTPGNGVTLLRNPRYWGVPPTFDRLLFGETESEFVSMVKYGNRETDILRCTPETFEKAKRDPKLLAFSDPKQYSSAFGGYTYIGWNQLRKREGAESATRFADKRVRQAMTMLLDRERLVREIYLGYGNVASGPFAPTGPQSDKSVKPWPYDVARAKSLLREAGFEDRDGNGVIEGADGTPFRFTLTYPSGSAITEKIVLFVKDSFSAAGIVMEPESVDWPVLINKLNASDFEAVTLGWSASPESDPYQTFHSSQIAGQGDNRTAYRNEDLDKVIDQARVTMDQPARMKLWNRVHATLHEDQPYTFLVNRSALRMFDKRVRNVTESPLGLNYEHMNGGAIPWFVPKSEQRRTQ